MTGKVIAMDITNPSLVRCVPRVAGNTVMMSPGMST